MIIYDDLRLPQIVYSGIIKEESNYCHSCRKMYCVPSFALSTHW